jgi:hypothetical protein
LRNHCLFAQRIEKRLWSALTCQRFEKRRQAAALQIYEATDCNLAGAVDLRGYYGGRAASPAPAAFEVPTSTAGSAGNSAEVFRVSAFVRKT